MISLNIRDVNHTFGGDSVSEFEIGIVQVAETAKPATIKVCYLLTLENGKSKAGVVLTLSKVIVLIRWCLVTLLEVPEEHHQH